MNHHCVDSLILTKILISVAFLPLASTAYITVLLTLVNGSATVQQ